MNKLLMVGLILVLIAAIVATVAGPVEARPEMSAVLVGMVCGVAAGIPTSALLLVALTRRARQTAQPPAYSELPPVERMP